MSLLTKLLISIKTATYLIRDIAFGTDKVIASHALRAPASACLIPS